MNPGYQILAVQNIHVHYKAIFFTLNGTAFSSLWLASQLMLCYLYIRNYYVIIHDRIQVWASVCRYIMNWWAYHQVGYNCVSMSFWLHGLHAWPDNCFFMCGSWCKVWPYITKVLKAHALQTISKLIYNVKSDLPLTNSTKYYSVHIILFFMQEMCIRHSNRVYDSNNSNRSTLFTKVWIVKIEHIKSSDLKDLVNCIAMC